jgi:hypothetical protein
VDGSVAQGASGSGSEVAAPGVLDRVPAIVVGGALVGLALLAYLLPGHARSYDHFVWQAVAFLDGRAQITWPVNGNAYFQDVWPAPGPNGEPVGFGLLPFPPLPAIVLLPAVAVFGLATDVRIVSAVLGAVAVGAAWWGLGRLRPEGLAVDRRVLAATVAFFAVGTVFWYSAQLGTTWFFAHVVAVLVLFLAAGVALAADPGADGEVDELPGLRTVGGGLAAALRHPGELVDGRQFLAGVLFGLAATARLTVVFGAPFFMLVGGGGTWVRRSVSAGLGAAIPVGALLAYNLATTGHLFHPGYEYLYQLEANGYPMLGYHPAWSIEDVRYLPQNLGILLLSTPSILPSHAETVFGPGDLLCTAAGATRSLFDPACPVAMPKAVGMSILLTSPAYLLAIPALVGPRTRLVSGAFLAVVAIAFVNLLHFSQGWVQFGYRFSNDFVVFALVLVAAGMTRRGGVGRLGVALVAVSVVVNLWGVVWGNVLGW